jgi:hypothetical protein
MYDSLIDSAFHGQRLVLASFFIVAIEFKDSIACFELVEASFYSITIPQLLSNVILRLNSLFHSHIVMNTVNINDGKLYHSGRSELKQLAIHIHEVTGNYCKAVIKKDDDKY